MLGLFGIVGALLAGLVADSMIGGLMGKTDDDDDGPSGAPQDAATETETPVSGPDLLDWPGEDADPDTDAGDNPANPGPDDPDFVPRSSDLPSPDDPVLTLLGGGADDILSGLGGNDTLAGGDGDDQLTGRGGDDFIQGGSGNDIAHGGEGADLVQGGTGDDQLAGENGDDRLVGGEGSDALSGHEGEDSLYGGAGADTVLGGGGDDQLIGGDAGDWLAGGLGDDHLVGDAGRDELDGGAGNDVLDGRETFTAFPEADFLNGGEGDDLLYVGAGDYATGGGGADLFKLSDLAAGDAVANIADYDAAADRLVVVFDPAIHPDPQLSLETPENSDDVLVLLDGVPLAMVQGGAGMTLADVLLTPAQAA